MNFPGELKYTKDHEWARINDNMVTVGITDYAQQELGDVVYVECNDAGTRVEQGGVFGTVESVKAVSELYAPVTGTIVEANKTLEDTPELVNTDCYGDAWMIAIELTDPSELDNLMDAGKYETYVSTESK
ncbi:MAG: glycine cleavage system protein GcvH [Thermodesulfobacteriota bacterium]|nr:glycine cleavage system protein GcvH [Thermodesulfobacteriota bacterium]